ncbi:hypothetical protein BV20DRAFT_799898 [Pilatotrama ljubarskyi]|nr:hypothetical protein BV20DRAFT_799898 [Pilatotrama ljubarskyi]
MARLIHQHASRVRSNMSRIVHIVLCSARLWARNPLSLGREDNVPQATPVLRHMCVVNPVSNSTEASLRALCTWYRIMWNVGREALTHDSLRPRSRPYAKSTGQMGGRHQAKRSGSCRLRERPLYRRSSMLTLEKERLLHSIQEVETEGARQWPRDFVESSRGACSMSIVAAFQRDVDHTAAQACAA